MSTHPEKLRNLAQNEYMIDTLYLPVGRALNEAAEHIESLGAEVERLTDEITAQQRQNDALDADLAAARAERDGLAKALDLFLDRLPGASYHELVESARAALAALPPKEDDDG